MKKLLYINMIMILIAVLSACGEQKTVTKTLIQTRYSSTILTFTKYSTTAVPFIRYTTVYVPVPATIIVPLPATTQQPTQGYPQTIKTIPFPTGVTYFSDLAYDRLTNTAWLLAGNDTGKPKWFIQIDTSGAVLKKNLLPNLPFWVNYASYLTFDGTNIWATSYGSSSGGQVSKIYTLDTSGNVLKEMPCPATTTGGYCQGIAWDGTKFWTVASDSKDLVSFFPDGTVSTKFSGMFPEISQNRNLFYDWSKSRLIASGLDSIDTSTGNRVRTWPFNGGGRGDWDGQYFWNINTFTQEIEITDLGI